MNIGWMRGTLVCDYSLTPSHSDGSMKAWVPKYPLHVTMATLPLSIAVSKSLLPNAPNVPIICYFTKSQRNMLGEWRALRKSIL